MSLRVPCYKDRSPKGNRIIVTDFIYFSKAPYFLREIGNGEIQVSLVLLHWKRLANFKTIFDHLSQYKFINEYIVS